jgi:hypothetical protein
VSALLREVSTLIQNRLLKRINRRVIHLVPGEILSTLVTSIARKEAT